MQKSKVLFLCVGNSCRSQMAEGFLRHLAGDRFEVASAGTQPVGVHPLAVEVMQDAGIDISQHRSKNVSEFVDDAIEFVITVCDPAKEACPVFPRAKKMIHWSFDDPAAAPGSPEERRAVFRRVRGEIAGQVQAFIASEV